LTIQKGNQHLDIAPKKQKLNAMTKVLNRSGAVVRRAGRVVAETGQTRQYLTGFSWFTPRNFATLMIVRRQNCGGRLRRAGGHRPD
jgi:hypothetical protein